MRSKLFILFLLIILLPLLTSCRATIEQKRNMISPIPFEKAKWDARDYEDKVQFRPGIARKLVADKSLIGKSRAEIIELLGESQESHDTSTNVIRYELEGIYGWNIDPIAIEYLKITFDVENKVGKAEIEFHKTGDWRE